MRRTIQTVTVLLLAALMPSMALAASAGPMDLTTRWEGILALVLFVVAYVLVATEEFTDLSKSKPIVFTAGIIWALVALTYTLHGGDQEAVEGALVDGLAEFTELFLFLLVAMTYVNTMTDRHVFQALRNWLTSREYSYRKLFWITGGLAFFLSPFLDNLTTALVLSAVVLAVGRDSPRFVAISCVNIVVAANAGGAFSPFGDITTLMVWQAGQLGFARFFELFPAALVDVIVPALCMHFFLPHGKPEATGDSMAMRRGALGVIALFVATVVTAVVIHQVLHLPPFLGMMLGLGYLKFYMYYLMKTNERWESQVEEWQQKDETTPVKIEERAGRIEDRERFNIFGHIADAEWDTLLFFYGVILCVSGLGFIGYLSVTSNFLYGMLGPTIANGLIGALSAIVDNIPIMAAVLHMDPDMDKAQWLLITLTAGVGGSLLSVGSAAGVALMGQAKGKYTFVSHLKWTPAIALGYVLSILTHLLITGELGTLFGGG
ncbi:sodium:proton antiporter NhaD [Kushneria phosphatilytica]|nr:sodium:proton antiporter NhaD [Kushneria phosphatilytica]OHV09522.1 sodium:proton antiporter [Kushneria phosphatilytica]